MKKFNLIMLGATAFALSACEASPVLGVETVALIDEAAISELVASNESLKAQLAHMQAVNAKAEIIQLVHAYGFARDGYDGQAYADVFAPDGKFHFQGQVFQGHAAIAARVPPKSEATGPTLHLVTTSHVELTSSTTATGRHYGMVYTGDFAADGAPGPVPGRLAINGVYNDSYVLTDKGWKIADRAFTPILN